VLLSLCDTKACGKREAYFGKPKYAKVTGSATFGFPSFSPIYHFVESAVFLSSGIQRDEYIGFLGRSTFFQKRSPFFAATFCTCGVHLVYLVPLPNQAQVGLTVCFFYCW
jgi:hypothetical protein